MKIQYNYFKFVIFYFKWLGFIFGFVSCFLLVNISYELLFHEESKRSLNQLFLSTAFIFVGFGIWKIANIAMKKLKSKNEIND